MAIIAVALGKDYEDSEYEKPAEALRAAGNELVVVGLKAGDELSGKQGKSKARVERAFSEVKPGDFDALFIPGGHSPDNLRAHPEPVSFAGEFVRSGKPVLCICHGPQLLISADVLKGRTVTGWRSIAKDITNAGANYVDREVVRDGNLVFSRQPDDIPAFNRACLSVLAEYQPRGNEPAKSGPPTAGC
jgi:protease I